MRWGRLTSLWALLASPAAITWPVPVLATAFGLIGPLTIDRQRVGGSVGAWLLVALVAQLVLVGIVVACRPLGGRSSWLTVVVLAVASVGRGVALALGAWMAGLTATPEFGYRIGPAAIATFGVLIAFALAVSSYHRHRAVAADLAARQHAVAELTGSLRERLDAVQHDLTDEVHRSLDPLIADLDRQLESLEREGDAGAALGSIRALVDDDLRPLSHRLAEPIAVEIVAGPVVRGARTPRVPLPSRLRLSRLLDPAAMGILAGIVSSSQSLRTPNVATAIAFPILTGLLTAAGTAIARLVLGRWDPRLWLGVLVTALVGGASLSLALVIQRSIGLAVPAFVQSAGALVGIVVGVITAVFVAVDARRTATEEDLRASIASLESLAGVLRQHAFAARRHLSSLLHGTIQSTLHAAAMRLAAPGTPTPMLLREVRADIVTAVARLDEPHEAPVRIIDMLSDIAELWDGTCTVRWTLDHQTVHVLSTSASLAMSAAEITRECVTNAIKHGGATEVWITIARSGDRVVLSALDNGSGIVDGTPGLGSRLLDESCAVWRRESTSDGTQVTAELVVMTP